MSGYLNGYHLSAYHVVQIIGLAMALLLAARALSTRRGPKRPAGWMVIAWIAIIIVVTLGLSLVMR